MVDGRIGAVPRQSRRILNPRSERGIYGRLGLAVYEATGKNGETSGTLDETVHENFSLSNSER